MATTAHTSMVPGEPTRMGWDAGHLYDPIVRPDVVLGSDWIARSSLDDVPDCSELPE